MNDITERQNGLDQRKNTKTVGHMRTDPNSKNNNKYINIIALLIINKTCSNIEKHTQ